MFHSSAAMLRAFIPRTLIAQATILAPHPHIHITDLADNHQERTKFCNCGKLGVTCGSIVVSCMQEAVVNVFSEAVLDHTLNPRNIGPLENASNFGQFGEPGGGPYVQMWFDLKGETIVDAAYKTYGCPAVVASASLSCQLLKGRTTAQALLLDEKDLMLLLGGLPEGKDSCPQMVIQAIRSALADGGNTHGI